MTCGPGHGIRYSIIEFLNQKFSVTCERKLILFESLSFCLPLSIGSLGNHNSRACVSNITVSDSVIKVSANGVRIKTWQGGSGAVSGIKFSNIHMDNVRNPIIVDQFYCLSKKCTNQTSAVFVSDILYSNIKGTYDVRSPPMHFACSDSVPCTNLTLTDVELLPAQGDLVLDPFCWNAYGDRQTLTIPPVLCLLEGMPRSLLDNDIGYCWDLSITYIHVLCIYIIERGIMDLSWCLISYDCAEEWCFLCFSLYMNMKYVFYSISKFRQGFNIFLIDTYVIGILNQRR